MDPLPGQVEYSVHTQSGTYTHIHTHMQAHTNVYTHQVVQFLCGSRASRQEGASEGDIRAHCIIAHEKHTTSDASYSQ